MKVMKKNLWKLAFFILGVIDYGVILMISSYIYGIKVGLAMIFYPIVGLLYLAAVKVWKDIFSEYVKKYMETVEKV
jgi:hypothetical protein